MATTVKRTISLRPEQAEWLKEHPEVNFSGYVQRWLDNLIEAYAGKLS